MAERIVELRKGETLLMWDPKTKYFIWRYDLWLAFGCPVQTKTGVLLEEHCDWGLHRDATKCETERAVAHFLTNLEEEGEIENKEDYVWIDQKG